MWALAVLFHAKVFINNVQCCRPESNTPIPQQAVHGRGLTAYDTVAV